MDFIREYWWLILIVAIAGVIAVMLLRPRQRVELTDSAPIRPHMAHTRVLRRVAVSLPKPRPQPAT